jgi:starvation-inducible outer membrane lipoprotein
MRTRLPLLIVISAILGGCAYPVNVIPPDVDRTINYEVGYSQVRQDPKEHVGTTVLLGGEIQNIQNLHNGTEVEILQMPIDEYARPYNRYASQGRFFFLSKEILDKALFTKGSTLTVACKISGSKSVRFDQADVRYPYCTAEFLYLWPPASSYAYGDPGDPAYGYPPYYGSWSLYWGYPFGYYNYYPYHPYYPYSYQVVPRSGGGRVFRR